MFKHDTNYEKYNFRKNITADQNHRIHLEVSGFTSLLKQHHTTILYTNIQELPNEQGGKKLGKAATKPGGPLHHFNHIHLFGE